MKLDVLLLLVERATMLADALVGEHDDAFTCLCAAIGYSLAAEHCDNPQKQKLIDTALECVSDALDLGFDNYVTLRDDKDFAVLQKLDEYHELINDAESK